jgi:FkbM family methyltransferase
MKAVEIIQALPCRSFLLRIWNRVMWLRGPHVTDTRFGAKMLCDARDIIQSTICHFGVWEPELTELVSTLLKRGDTAVDLGANIGYYSLFFSKLVGPSGHVIAVEAHPRIAGKLRDNLALNDVTNVSIEAVAVTREPGEVQLYEAPAGNIGMTTLNSDRGFQRSMKVPASTLLSVIPDPGSVTLIKCDIEGAEIPVMEQLLDNLHRFNPRLSLLVEATYSDEWKHLFNRFRENGFKAWAIPNSLDSMWRKLLDRVADAPVEIQSLPEGQSDLLFKR